MKSEQIIRQNEALGVSFSGKIDLEVKKGHQRSKIAKKRPKRSNFEHHQKFFDARRIMVNKSPRAKREAYVIIVNQSPRAKREA